MTDYYRVIEWGRSPHDVRRLLGRPPSLEVITDWVQVKILGRVRHNPDTNYATCRTIAASIRESVDASTIERAILAFGTPEQKSNAREIAKALAAERCGRAG